MNRAMIFLSIGIATTALAACGHQQATTAATTADSTVATNEPAAAQASAPAAKADGGILDACSLFTQADAESVLGTPAKSVEHAQDDEFSSHCTYESADQSHGSSNVEVEIHTDEDVTHAKTGLEIARKMYSSNTAGTAYDYEELTGIGDGALLASTKTQPGIPAEVAAMMPHQQILFFIKGAKDMRLVAGYTGGTGPMDSLKAVAKKLADHF